MASQWRKTAEDLASKKALLDFGGMSWQVLALDGNKALLITTDVIDELPYDENSEAEEVTWSICTLRKYLNSNFLKNFNSNEIGQILDVDISNDDNEKHGIRGGQNTTDKIFLLSIKEAQQYLNNDEPRIVLMNDESTAWWLRSPGDYTINAAIVDETGSVDYSGQCVDFKAGVRPVLWRVMS